MGHRGRRDGEHLLAGSQGLPGARCPRIYEKIGAQDSELRTGLPGDVSFQVEEVGMTKAMNRLVGAMAVALSLAVSGAWAEDGITNDTILLGGYGPVTGPSAFLGLGGRDGASIAIEEINA